MSAGDKEIILASEEVIRRNVQTCVAYSKSTRELVRTLEEKVLRMEAQLQRRDTDIQELRNQLSIVQQKLYSGGS